MEIKNQKLKTANLEIAEKDCPKDMNWEEAVVFCASLGDGWRLPNTNELYEMYNLQKQGLLNLGKDDMAYYYWSSDEEEDLEGAARAFCASDDGSDECMAKFNLNTVRAVRTLK